MARDRWDKRAAFVLAAIGSAIGLGNVWRFPDMAYSNGGGALFIPYYHRHSSHCPRVLFGSEIPERPD